jgi:hypothetical protein
MPPKLGRSVLVDKREGGWVRIDELLGRTARVRASLRDDECLFEAFVNLLHNHSSHSVRFICAYSGSCSCLGLVWQILVIKKILPRPRHTRTLIESLGVYIQQQAEPCSRDYWQLFTTISGCKSWRFSRMTLLFLAQFY